MMIYEVRDSAPRLLDSRWGTAVSQNVGGVSHFVADLGVVIRRRCRGTGWAGSGPGTSSSPTTAVAGQHLNNIMIYLPYFLEGELLRFSRCGRTGSTSAAQSTGFGAGSR